jgi:hypothetical protein
VKTAIDRKLVFGHNLYMIAERFNKKMARLATVRDLAVDVAHSSLDAHGHFVPASVAWDFIVSNDEDCFGGKAHEFNGIMPRELQPFYREAQRQIIDADRCKQGHAHCDACGFDKWDTLTYGEEMGIKNPICCEV